MTREMGRMKEHKFRLIGVDLKTNTQKPIPNKGSHMAKLSKDARKGLTGSEDTAIIHIKGDVRITWATKT